MHYAATMGTGYDNQSFPRTGPPSLIDAFDRNILCRDWLQGSWFMTFEIGGICPHCRSTFRCDCFAAEAAPTGELYQNEL